MTRKWTALGLVNLGLTLAFASAFAQPAAADPVNLTGGVLIAHHCSECTWTGDPPPEGWCAAYAPYAIQSLAEVNVQLPYNTERAFWYVLAAWESEDKTWCGVEFGLGDYDEAIYSIADAGACAPSEYLEIPTAGWPGPNQGTAFVTTGETHWSGNWVPVYWFFGYVDPIPGGSTTIPITVNPPTGYCQFCSCPPLPHTYAVGLEQRGVLGANAPGYVPVFPPVAEPWACCLPDPPDLCVMLPEEECLDVGGIWIGEPFTCDPNPCPAPGACCIMGECFIVMEEVCAQVGGTFYGPGTTCDPDPCEGVCCYEVPGTVHACAITHRADCLAFPGFWHPEWTSCEPNPCEIYTPTEGTSWGKIKSMYR